jgi:uncharacterized protein YeaO (DUF488 family)
MEIQIKRVYSEPSASDGYRVLVDRLWPRGLSKERAGLDEWAKEIAPSTELRKWFHKDRSRWSEFRKRYLRELADHREELRALKVRTKDGTLTLLYASADPGHNHAEVIAEYLNMLKKG